MIAVVIPSFKVTPFIRDLLKKIGPEVGRIYVVDDACPDGSGKYVEGLLQKSEITDSRIQVLFHEKNQGVGGAVITGFRKARLDGAKILVKLDGDGQMDPAFIPVLVKPIKEGHADYTKGNRFFSPEGLSQMPWIRLVGNAALSFLTKLTTGLWSVMDPTNGYVALDGSVFDQLDTKKIAKDYFFETDMLFRLALLGALVKDIPMQAHYGDEKSNLRIGRVLVTFPGKHFKRFLKRIFYQYFLRDFSVASIELILGSASFLFSLVFGLSHYLHGQVTGIKTGAGALAITTISFLFAVQMLLAFFAYDTRANDRGPISQVLGTRE